MDKRLLRILGGETKFYPYALEKQFPRILAKIMKLWDQPGIADYFTGLMVSDRPDRAGFPPDVAAEIIRLSLVHASAHEPGKNSDVWDASTDKFASYKSSVPIKNANEWKRLPASMAIALERMGIPDSARGFHSAAESGNRAAVSIFLQARINTEIHNERGWTPLMMAAFNGHNEVISIMMKYRANVHAKDLLGNTSLHWAIDAGHTSSSKLLIENGADIDACNNVDITPLFRATMRRRLRDVMLLIDSGANLDMATREGLTALHKAAAEGYIEIVRTLVSRGANIKIKDLDGNLPITLALNNNHQDAFKFLASSTGDLNPI